ncbi:MAG: thiosulfate oxidation carrier complex protein SoxZ [Methylococcaceae bacterium]|nr:thiosulfate oxidation carrier complex protein SoxZ [Methylococcaceae bacterium]
MASIKIRTKRLEGKTQIRLLIAHPMEHGRNKDKLTGQLIPAHFIKELTVKHNDRVIISSDMAGMIAKNPYFAFMLNDGQAGDKITVSWIDNFAQTDRAEVKII